MPAFVGDACSLASDPGQPRSAPSSFLSRADTPLAVFAGFRISPQICPLGNIAATNRELSHQTFSLLAFRTHCAETFSPLALRYSVRRDCLASMALFVPKDEPRSTARVILPLVLAVFWTSSPFHHDAFDAARTLRTVANTPLSTYVSSAAFGVGATASHV